MWVQDCIQLYVLILSFIQSCSSLGFSLVVGVLSRRYQMPPTPHHRHVVTMCGVLSLSGSYRTTLPVPREVGILLNDESSFQEAGDTCCHFVGWRARDVASSDSSH